MGEKSGCSGRTSSREIQWLMFVLTVCAPKSLNTGCPLFERIEVMQ